MGDYPGAMGASPSLTKSTAARLLGVAPDAAAVEVKRAFRLWATLAHPDQGGSAARFAELCAARDLLLEVTPAPQAPARSRTPQPSHEPAQPRPRRPWRDVLVRPTPLVAALLGFTAIVGVAMILVAGSVAGPLAVAPAGVASALWCVAVSRAILRRADHGHVIVARTAAWTCVTAAQLLTAVLLGLAVIEVLPVLVLPFVVAIALVNPAAGLRRAPGVNVR
ncbi:MAG: DnaJ domain [Actinomycetota bacterium]|jgi:hypothetical protein